jgi:hypothetical protein
MRFLFCSPSKPVRRNIAKTLCKLVNRDDTFASQAQSVYCCRGSGYGLKFNGFNVVPEFAKSEAEAIRKTIILDCGTTAISVVIEE